MGSVHSRPETTADAGVGNGEPELEGVHTAWQLHPAEGHPQPGQGLPTSSQTVPSSLLTSRLPPRPTSALMGGGGEGRALDLILGFQCLLSLIHLPLIPPEVWS